MKCEAGRGDATPRKGARLAPLRHGDTTVHQFNEASHPTWGQDDVFSIMESETTGRVHELLVWRTLQCVVGYEDDQRGRGQRESV